MDSRSPFARIGAVLGAAALALALPAPAAAHGDRERLERLRETYPARATTAGAVTSGNVQHVHQVPGQVGISGCFMHTKQLFVTSGLDSVKVFDVGNPAVPELTGTLPSLQFENEAMNCGERRTKDGVKRFALIGVDLYQASEDIQHVNVGGGELVVVDVTDPFAPRIRSRVAGTTSTHTVACVDPVDCRYAYSAGDSGDGTFSIFDLRNLGEPKELDADPDKPGTQPFTSPTAGHKWNFDEAGFGTHTGFDGTALFDVSSPRRPELVTTTGRAGRGEDPEFEGWNDFIHHNSARPNADAFRAFAKPRVGNGNVLFVTEEDYEQTDCTQAGSFQTWKVKTLNGDRNAIVPLDKVELADLSELAPPRYAFCSAHWFDYHPSGVVAVGFYGGGLQLVDARNPRDLKAYGQASWGASEVWDAYWVPRYDRFGVMTSGRTHLVYTVDAVRGLDVYNVDLPGDGDDDVTAPSRLGPGSPLALAWPEEGVPLSVVTLALLVSAAVRRRSRHRIPA